MLDVVPIDMPGIGATLINSADISAADRGLAVVQMNDALQVEILESTRPDVTMCRGEDGFSKVGYTVYAEGEVKGFFSMYHIEEIDGQTHVLQAYPMPGFIPWGGHDKLYLWGYVMDFFLKNPMEVSDGPAYDVAKWNLPDTENGHNWDAHPGEDLGDLFAPLSDHVIKYEVTDGGLHRISVSRAGVP